MSAQILLDRLEGVRRTTSDRWMARCPAHDDRRPSLSVKEANGKILLTCFAGCTISEVVSALGLKLSDLFPESDEKPQGKRLRVNRAEVEHERLVLQIALSDMSRGVPINDLDRSRANLALQRLEALP